MGKKSREVAGNHMLILLSIYNLGQSFARWEQNNSYKDQVYSESIIQDSSQRLKYSFATEVSNIRGSALMPSLLLTRGRVEIDKFLVSRSLWYKTLPLPN